MSPLFIPPRVAAGVVSFFVVLALSTAAMGQATAGDFFASAHAKKAKGDLDGAIADYSRAIELNPGYLEAFNDRGLAKHDKGDIDGAIADYNRAIEADPKYVKAA